MTKLLSGDAEAAEQPIAESLEAFRQIGHRRGEAWALQNLAWIAFTRGEMVEAEERLDESAATFRAVGDQGGLGWALGLLGFVRYFQGRFDEAGELAEAIVKETRESGDRWGLGMTYMLLASVRLFVGRVAEAAEHAAKRSTCSARLATPNRRASSSARGRALVMSGKVSEGLEVMQSHVAGAPNFVGLIPAATAVQLGDPEAAEEALNARIVADPLTGDTIGYGERSVVMGLTELQLGKVTEAIAHLEAADRDAYTEGERAYAKAALTLAYAAGGTTREGAGERRRPPDDVGRHLPRPDDNGHRARLRTRPPPTGR